MSTAQNPIMSAAWADFIMWCEEQPETVAAFNAETGRAYMKPKPPIEAMIDDATGKAQEDAFAFARWVTENHWGMEYAPKHSAKNAREEIGGKRDFLLSRLHPHGTGPSPARRPLRAQRRLQVRRAEERGSRA